ncbi:hypothetical protein [Clostridium oceanicum]|uniref:Lipoprotein n=1 Tax=Clostridium oceanicum TaxID=1543 RepID=A0ABN1JBP1_9CLOT
MIKEQQESYNGDGSKSSYRTEYTIKFNQKFDKDTFTFDKSKLKK